MYDGLTQMARCFSKLTVLELSRPGPVRIKQGARWITQRDVASACPPREAGVFFSEDVFGHYFREK